MIIISKSNIFFELFLEKMLIGIQKKKIEITLTSSGWFKICFKTLGWFFSTCDFTNTNHWDQKYQPTKIETRLNLF